MNVNTRGYPLSRHGPLRKHTPYTTPYESRSMRALAALRMVWACVIMTRQIKSVSTGKKSPLSVHLGEPGHTRDTRAHGHTDHTDEPHNQPNPHQRTRTAQPRDDRIRGRLIHNKQPQPRSRPLPAALTRGQLRRGRYCSSAHDGVPGPCRFGITPSVSSKLRRSHACKFRCPCNGFLLNVPADRRRVVHDVDAP